MPHASLRHEQLLCRPLGHDGPETAWLRSAGAPKAGGSRTGRGVAHAPGLVALIHGDRLVALIGDRLAGGQHHPTDPLDLIPERVDLNATNQRRLSPVHLVSALCGRTAEQHTAGLVIAGVYIDPLGSDHPAFGDVRRGQLHTCPGCNGRSGLLLLADRHAAAPLLRSAGGRQPGVETMGPGPFVPPLLACCRFGDRVLGCNGHGVACRQRGGPFCLALRAPGAVPAPLAPTAPGSGGEDAARDVTSGHQILVDLRLHAAEARVGDCDDACHQPPDRLRLVWRWKLSESTDDRNWLQRSGLEQAGFAEAYVASLHWSLTQFTPATNSIAPDNALERFFAICVILLAMCVFSSFIGTISATVNSLRNAQGQKLKQEENLLRFFIERNLSLDLYSKVQEVVRRERLTEARLSEEEVELLQRLPQRFKMQMHEEMYLFALLHLGIWPPWSSPDTDPVFNTLCHHAMKDHLAKPGEDVFMPGTACHHVCIIESGHMSYSLAGAPPEEATPGSVVALPCLWAEWSHCGRLMARTGSCYYVTLNGDDFCEVVMRFGGPLLRFLQIMGVLLIGELESAQDQSQLSDLTSLSNIREVSERAQRFTKLIGTTPDKSVHATFSILANKAQGGLFGRLQTRNLSPFG
ncbi:unnamed protein product [Effrenium voratum]|nr:unnamed protein product [Effrenium voratum]